MSWQHHGVTETLPAIEMLAVTVLRGLAGVLGAWLAVTTLASAARRAVPGWRRCARLDGLTLPIVRRLLDALLGAAVLASALPPASALAQGSPRADVAVVRTPAPRPEAGRPVARTVGPHGIPSAPPVAAPARSAHRVVAGDSLWSIAHAELRRRAHGAPIADRDVAHYLRRVIAANHDRLRSGNPSVIFPGEIVALPA